MTESQVTQRLVAILAADVYGYSRLMQDDAQATVATLEKLTGVNFLPSLCSHPIGYQGHGLGANLNARNGVLGPPEEHDSRLRPGSYRSIELSAKTPIPEWKGDSLLIPFEDDAYLTDTGYEWFRPTQTRWYLIR